MNIDAALLTKFAVNQSSSSAANARSIGLGGTNGDANDIDAAMQDRGDDNGMYDNGGEGDDDGK